ncbi:hypothetical protein DNTS_012222 [Danionella cerebrum]|uniref:Uncharacterized protein n=1 Tax=Danionella cerebrum TaxID=2873325 RepID=A0A553N265_9TELE|nr:hypothetical protein DNTS_012222 [Danionella translucida]
MDPSIANVPPYADLRCQSQQIHPAVGFVIACSMLVRFSGRLDVLSGVKGIASLYPFSQKTRDKQITIISATTDSSCLCQLCTAESLGIRLSESRCVCVYVCRIMSEVSKHLFDKARAPSYPAATRPSRRCSSGQEGMGRIWVSTNAVKWRKNDEGYGVIVLNPNENSLEVEKVPDPAKKASPDASDEPAEKRERKDENENKKRKDFYEKYRNPQKEREMEHIPIRAAEAPLLPSLTPRRALDHLHIALPPSALEPPGLANLPAIIQITAPAVHVC